MSRLLVLCFLTALWAGKSGGSAPIQSRLCTVCNHDPAVMQKGGVVSHGPMPIGRQGSAWIESEIPARHWLFLETAHLRLAFALGEERIDLADRERVESELDRLRALFPAVPVKPKRLDPWLRLHLLGMRAEEFYFRFQKLLGVTDDDFPETRDMDGPFMGDGRYLGEKDKFEVVIHDTRAGHHKLTESLGAGAPTDALRMHLPGLHKFLISIPAEDAELRQGRWLLPHVVHCLSHAMFCAYKHFSYDPPIWLDEGLALCMEKEIEPRSTTNEGEEGGKMDARGPSDFRAAARKLAASGKAPRLATLAAANEFAVLGENEKVAVWGMLRFLIDEHPDKLAQFLGAIKGQLDDQGQPSGLDLDALQRKSMKELWGWNSIEFDSAWQAWAVKR